MNLTEEKRMEARELLLSKRKKGQGRFDLLPTVFTNDELYYRTTVLVELIRLRLGVNETQYRVGSLQKWLEAYKRKQEGNTPKKQLQPIHSKRGFKITDPETLPKKEDIEIKF